MKSKQDVCCEKFDTSLWDEKTHVWKGKLFLKDEVAQFMHMPLNMGPVVTRMVSKVDKAGAMPETKDFLMLCYDPSPWKSEIYMTITKPVPDGETVKLSGKFISKVFDGPYNHVPKWIEEMDKYLDARKQKAIKYYFHYAYCPKCMKKYGHNYCVAFAQVN